MRLLCLASIGPTACLVSAACLVSSAGLLSSACSNAESPPPSSNGSTTASASADTSTSAATTGAGTTGTPSGGGGAASTAAVTGDATTSSATTSSTSTTSSTDGGVPSTVVPGAEGFNCAPADGSVPNLKLTKLVGDLQSPTGVYGAPGESDRVFVTLQGGLIEILRGTTLTTFLDLSSKVEVDAENQADERGLLGMAFHPDFQNNGKFFITYTTGDALADGLIQYVSEFTASGDTVDPSTERNFTQFDQRDNNHNGGGMAIGLDGYLYISVGDGGFEGRAVVDQYMNGQNPNTELGKILRYTLDGVPAPGNMPGAAPDIWDMGLRNPWRISFDGCTGDFYIADVGYTDENDSSPPTEEVNVEPPASGHKNYGWPVMEGANCRDTGCDTSLYVVPVDSYLTLSGTAIIGGYVYRGSAIPGLRGTYIYGDYGQAIFRAFEYVGGAAQNAREITDDISPFPNLPFQLGNIISFGQDGVGEMYVIAWTNGGVGGPSAPANIGDLYRIDPE